MTTKKKSVTKKGATKKKGKKKLTLVQKAKIKAERLANPQPGDRLGGKTSKAVHLTNDQRESLMNGNSFWCLRSSHGRKPTFRKPEHLMDAASQYFEACEANPLKEEKVGFYMGEGTITKINKMRVMTLEGLQIFLDISDDTWRDYARQKDFSGVCAKIKQIIYNNKFSGASADLLNAAIIARDLGLKDKVDHSSEDGSMSTQPLTKKQKEMLEKLQDDEY